MKKAIVILVILIGVLCLVTAGWATTTTDPPIGGGLDLEAILLLLGGGVGATLVGAKLAGALLKNTRWGKQHARDIDKVLSILDNQETLDIIKHLQRGKPGRRDLAIDKVQAAISRNIKVLPDWVQVDSNKAATATVDKVTTIWHDKITNRGK